MRLFALAALLAAGPAVAQEPVTLAPGHPDLVLEDVQIGSEMIAVQMVAPQEQELGTVSETVTLEDGMLTVVTTTNVAMAGAASTDSSRFSWPTLMPLSSDVMGDASQSSAVYSDATVSGMYSTDRGPLPYEFDLPRPVFPSAAIPFIVRALPLEAGYRAIVPTFSASDRFKEVLLTVVGPVTVPLPDGTEVEAVAVTQAGGGGVTRGMAQRHFVDPTTREILYTTMDVQGMSIRFAPMTDADIEAAEEMAEAAASNRITPGHPELVAVAPQSSTLVVRIVQPVQQDFGTVTTTEVLEGDRLTFTSDVQIPQAGQNQQDTTVVAYPSLEPISRVEIKPDGTERSTFADGRMMGTATEGSDAITIDAALEGAFGPGITRHLVRSLPLAEGYAASFDQIDGDGEISTSRVRVTGQQSYTRPDGTESMVWVVFEEEESQPTYEYYVDTETRELLMVAFAPQPGVRVEMSAE